jgi:hypothetical protein
MQGGSENPRFGAGFFVGVRKAEGQRQSYQALLFRANAARNELCVRIMEDHFVMFGHREQLGRSDLLAVDD